MRSGLHSPTLLLRSAKFRCFFEDAQWDFLLHRQSRLSIRELPMTDQGENRFDTLANILERLTSDLQYLVLVDRLCSLIGVNLVSRSLPSRQIFVVLLHTNVSIHFLSNV